ncbi:MULTISPECIES: PadR family transcriptional regulator [Uliginosibacterium]|uniref:PadR family transcriptional regulator n=1 Tax=Uliginosibacterium aquaticum TaxID=2731212 RepID=A0ABX2ICZ4_9RHOO|nr:MULTISPECIES: PadR family transcriptional regulator [Uliginosibacterium]MDO6387027.1 PadR family transcriptional regulator [Uliginosibacterium sp. 31-12]NSL54424.1 PadR family transcriptional regulator [Uliginosibacterium aquaticum]PLK49700.1 PadR family transcriptional regulator [Uliginosibacterium sp. TH139]
MRGMHHGHGGHPHGKHHRGGPMGEGREFRGGGMGKRMFEHGHLKLLVLSLLQEQPRHGYELIKAIEELAGGDYAPSPGVIYPTLTLLEELGQASVSEHGGKKKYAITAEGAVLLEAERETLERIRARLAAAGSVADARRSPELQRAIHNFKMALHLRLAKGELDAEATARITAAIDHAAQEIERS